MRLANYITQQLQQKSICLMTHVIAGYPSFEDNLKALEIMHENQVDLVEIQMPFTEPTADGPVFARANQEALKRGFNIDQYFKLVQTAVQRFNFPVLMMGYYNPVFKMSEARFIERLKVAGAAGFIIPDLPAEEGENLYRLAHEQALAPINLMTPTTPDDRLKFLGSAGDGFIYVVARAGVTGKHTRFSQDFEAYLGRCRAATQLPLAVGFGISEKSDLEFLIGKVEVAIIGTALLKIWERAGASGFRRFLGEMNSLR